MTVVIIFSIAVAASEALFGLCLGMILDSINMGNLNVLVHLLIVMVILIIFSISVSILSRSAMYKQASKNAGKLKDHVYSMEIKWERAREPDIASFTSKVDLLFDNFFMSRQMIILYVANFICACAVIIYINWIMFIVAVVTSSVPFVVPVIFKKKVQAAASEYADGSTEYTEFVTDTLSGRLELMKYNVAEKYIEKHRIANEHFEAKRIKNLVIRYLGEKSSEGVGNLMYISVLFAGGILVESGTITVGNVLSVVQLMNTTVVPIRMIVACINQINSCKPIYAELMKEENISETNSKTERRETRPVKCDPDAVGRLLVADNITYRYPESDKTVINGFSFRFMPGGKYLVKGESGSGKTTLAKILSGELVPDFGEVNIDGVNVSDIGCAERCRMVNYVEQSSYLFKDSVMNNVTLYREDIAEKEDEIKSRMETFGLKLDSSNVVRNVSGVSGGEKSRICLLRAMMDMPGVLIVDEPTAALDKVNADSVIRCLLDHPETVIVIAHNLAENLESNFDAVILLQNGKVMLK